MAQISDLLTVICTTITDYKEQGGHVEQEVIDCLSTLLEKVQSGGRVLPDLEVDYNHFWKYLVKKFGGQVPVKSTFKKVQV